MMQERYGALRKILCKRKSTKSKQRGRLKPFPFRRPVLPCRHLRHDLLCDLRHQLWRYLHIVQLLFVMRSSIFTTANDIRKDLAV